MTADELIRKLKLEPLPEEGGYFRETFRDSGRVPGGVLKAHEGERSFSTCIFYLITPEEFSGLHAVRSTEIFHFYAGDPVEMIQLSPEGDLQKIRLSSELSTGDSPQVVVPPLTWQGTRLVSGGKWALMGCTVAPGFEFSDFQGGTFEELSKMFPEHAEIIRDYTRC